MRNGLLFLTCFMLPPFAQAADVYQLTGLAQSFTPEQEETAKLDKPIIPHYAATLSLVGDVVTFHYGGGATCTARITERHPYVFSEGPISIIRGNDSEAKVAKFYQDKFQVDIKKWTFEYYLVTSAQDRKNTPNTACNDLLDGSVLYGSDSNLAVIDQTSFVYVFKRQPIGSLPLNPDAGFDCQLAKGKTESMICGNPALAKLDGDMANIFANLYVAEPSKSALWLKDQTDWLHNVRDKCDAVDCLTKAYGARNAYLQSKIPDEPN